MAPLADELVAVPGAMAGATRSSEAYARVIDATQESRAEKPVVPEEQTVLPEALGGSDMLCGHRPPWWCHQLWMRTK